MDTDWVNSGSREGSEEGKRMSSKDKPGHEKRKQHNPLLGDQDEKRREERRQKKQALKIVQRRSRKTGHAPQPS